MSNILILSAGRRVELVQSFMNELAARGLSAKVLTADIHPEISAACQVSDLAIKSPRVTEFGYIDFLVGICKKNNVTLVVPTIDTELLLLSQHRLSFESHGIYLVISEEAFIHKCRDKRLTSELFNQIGIDTPRIFSLEEIQYPCFAKPYDGSCSIGATLVESAGMLSPVMLSDPKMMFMELVDSSHVEYTVDAYYDRQEELKCFVPRQRLETRAGEVSKGVTKRHYVYEYLMSRLPLIKGARGCITLQLFSHPDSERFAALEINPRFGGGFPLSYSAGANYPGWLIDEYLLGHEITFKDDWESDLMMLRYDAKVLVHGFR